MLVKLREFAVTGCFGSISIGTTRAAVEALLGEPDEIGSLPSECRYGQVSLHWRDGALNFVFIDLTSSASGAIELDLTPFHAGMPLAGAIEQCRVEKIACQLEPKRVRWDFERLYVGVGVRLTFNEGEGAQGLLGVEYSPVYPRPTG
jgi:hypothetical protein